MSKKTVKLTFILVLLILAFTALDDITTGNEPALTGEYLTLFLTFPVFGYLLGTFWLYLMKITNKKITKLVHFQGYHFHHSTLGVLMILTAFFLYPLWFRIVVGGLGVGIFIHHIITDKLVFITKD
jgi:hypothetical protein